MIDSDFDRSYDQLWFCYQNNTFFILKQKVPVDNFFLKKIQFEYLKECPTKQANIMGCG